jgi:hypothetical protein
MHSAFLLFWVRSDHGRRAAFGLALPAVRHFEGTIVKRYALAATLSLLLSGAVQAATIDLNPTSPAQPTAGLSTAARAEAELPVSMSELPEPEVFAMMLVGLILIGYRASRDSSEKFDNGEKFDSEEKQK